MKNDPILFDLALVLFTIAFLALVAFGMKRRNAEKAAEMMVGIVFFLALAGAIWATFHYR